MSGNEIQAPKSKALGANPKDLLGVKKPSLSKIPAIALLWESLGLEGQEKADDSGCHHLGHARACLGILLDAQATGNLIDDRPVTEGSSAAYQSVLKEVSAAIPAMQQRHKDFHAAKNAQKP